VHISTVQEKRSKLEAIFLKKKYLLYTYPIDVLVVIFAIAPRNGSLNDLLPWLVVATLSHLAILPFFLIRFKASDEKSLRRQEIYILVLAGIARGIVIILGTSIFNLPGTHPAFLRPLNSAITVPLWFFAMHYTLDTRKLYYRKFQETYITFVNKLVDEFSESKQSKLDRESIEQELNETLEPLRQTLESIAGRELSSQDLEKESRFISNFIEERIRPLSHKMWEQPKIVPPKVSFLSLIRLSLFELKLPIGLLLIPTFIYQLVGATAIFGIYQATLRSSISFITFTAIFIMYNFFFRKQYLSEKILNSITLILCLSLPNILIREIFYPLVYPRSSFGQELVNFLWYISILIATSIAIGFHRYQERILGVFDLYLLDVNRSDRHEYFSYIHQQKYARYIHADIQSALVASSIELNRAAESGNAELGKNAIERAAQLLRRNHRQYVVGKAVDPKMKLREIVRSWNGIASINVTGFETILGATHTAILVCEVLEELVANSVRHGQAGFIIVNIAIHDKKAEVIFIDDGLHNNSKHKGLGTRILDKKTSTWSKDIFQDKNRVRFTVPL
jgi:hypothetical protein